MKKDGLGGRQQVMWHLATTPPCGSKRATLHSYNGGLLQNERWKVKGFDQLRFQSVQHLNSKRARGLKRATLHSCHPSVATFTLLSKHSCFFLYFPLAIFPANYVTLYQWPVSRPLWLKQTNFSIQFQIFFFWSFPAGYLLFACKFVFPASWSFLRREFT